MKTTRWLRFLGVLGVVLGAIAWVDERSPALASGSAQQGGDFPLNGRATCACELGGDGESPRTALLAALAVLSSRARRRRISRRR
jgi:MYXO-CTERM domain-containing protein